MIVEKWQLPRVVAKMATLTGNEKVLYAYLSSNPEVGREPNTQDMADACGVDKTTTLLAVKGLEKAKLIKVQRTSAKKLKRMVSIQVVSPKAAASAGSRKRK